jgi:hypothetical protein
MEEIRKTEGMSLEELEAQSVDLLPPREEMQLLSTGDATAINVAFVNQEATAVGIGGHASVWQSAEVNQFAAANSGFVGF